MTEFLKKENDYDNDEYYGYSSTVGVVFDSASSYTLHVDNRDLPYFVSVFSVDAPIGDYSFASSFQFSIDRALINYKLNRGSIQSPVLRYWFYEVSSSLSSFFFLS
jgi:hypothetical protein